MSRKGKYQYKNKILKRLIKPDQHLEQIERQRMRIDIKVRKENQDANDAQLTIGGLFLIIVVIIVIVAMMWFLLLPPSCDESDKVELVGVLRGFEKNNTLWDVRLNNVTLFFNYWDKSYMEKMLGYNVTIIACDRRVHFDFLTAFINPED